MKNHIRFPSSLPFFLSPPALRTFSLRSMQLIYFDAYFFCGGSNNR